MTLTPGDLWLIEATVALEAEGEPDDGMEGVARVIRNRMEGWRQDAARVCLGRLQFSCWNHDETRRLALSRLFRAPVWERVRAAVDRAFDPARPDITAGATHYLNLDVLPTPPRWYAPTRVTRKIGAHTFLTA